MACRDMDKCEKARQEIIEKTYNRKILCKKMDLASIESIKDFAEDFNKSEWYLLIYFVTIADIS